MNTRAMHLIGNKTAYFPFIHCIEAHQRTQPADAAKKCAKKMHVDLDPISACASGKQGANWEHEMATLTAALYPPHTYAPWITFDGVF
ncbi:GILT-like protein [Mya arenaria]|uniref:GILT-like protein n=1 Tax=Mya arenaria TaxID=6604 RepID=A0ABY7F7E1_MYAAR|nr:GILT-like protein [Mya arenaria]